MMRDNKRDGLRPTASRLISSRQNGKKKKKDVPFKLMTNARTQLQRLNGLYLPCLKLQRNGRSLLQPGASRATTGGCGKETHVRRSGISQCVDGWPGA